MKEQRLRKKVQDADAAVRVAFDAYKVRPPAAFCCDSAGSFCFYGQDIVERTLRTNSRRIAYSVQRKTDEAEFLAREALSMRTKAMDAWRKGVLELRAEQEL
jgi:hypothetical protein